MKWFSIQAFALTIFLTTAACASQPVPVHSSRSPSAAFGGSDGGGGNGEIAEFYTLVRLMAVAYKVVHSRTALGSRSTQIEPLYKKLKVEQTKEDLLLKGARVEAINYPSQGLIVFNSVAWGMKSQEEKLQLVVHEVLGLLKVDDPKYEVSSAILLEMRDEDLGKDVLRASQPLRLSSVNCRVFRNFVFHTPYKTFSLENMGKNGLSSKIYLTDKIFVEVSLSTGPRINNEIGIYSTPTETDSIESIGRTIAATSINFFGDPVDIKLKTPEWLISCTAN